MTPLGTTLTVMALICAVTMGLWWICGKVAGAFVEASMPAIHTFVEIVADHANADEGEDAS